MVLPITPPRPLSVRPRGGRGGGGLGAFAYKDRPPPPPLICALGELGTKTREGTGAEMAYGDSWGKGGPLVLKKAPLTHPPRPGCTAIKSAHMIFIEPVRPQHVVWTMPRGLKATPHRCGGGWGGCLVQGWPQRLNAA